MFVSFSSIRMRKIASYELAIKNAIQEHKEKFDVKTIEGYHLGIKFSLLQAIMINSIALFLLVTTAYLLNNSPELFKEVLTKSSLHLVLLAILGPIIILLGVWIYGLIDSIKSLVIAKNNLIKAYA